MRRATPTLEVASRDWEKSVAAQVAMETTSFKSLKVHSLPLGAAHFLQGSATLGFDFQVLDDCSLSNPLCWPFIADTRIPLWVGSSGSLSHLV